MEIYDWLTLNDLTEPHSNRSLHALHLVEIRHASIPQTDC